MRRETFSLITLLCVGCGDPLAPRQLVEKPRVLAARAETAADAAVATPERGQDAVVRVLLEAPTPLGAVPFALAACERDATLTGVPGCRDELTEVSGAAAEPSIPFTVPSDARALLVVGVACPEGVPRPASGVGAAYPDALGCSAGPALRMSFDVRLAPEVDNENPSIDEIRLDDAPWAENPSATVGGACVGGGGPEIAANAGAHRVSVRLPAAAREHTPAGREHLEVSWFSTAGALDRPVTFVEAEAPEAENEVSQVWTAPGAAPASGRWMELVIVVRDGRGGVVWQRRSLCVVP